MRSKEVEAERQAERNAKARMTRIRTSLKSAVKDYADAVRLRDWETLGYESMEAWRGHILGYTGLSRDARVEIVGTLTDIGMSQREIEAATGAGHATVVRDQREHAAGGPHGPRASARQQAARDREASRRAAVVALEDAPAEVSSDHEPAQAPEPVAPPVTTTMETEAKTEAKTAAGVREEVRAEVMTELAAKFETAFRDTEAERDQLAKENEKLKARVAEQAGKLDANFVPVLERRMKELEKENEKLGRGAKLARPCSAHQRSAEFITRCPECGR